MKAMSTALIACALGWVVHGSPTEARTEKVVYSFCGQQNCTDGYIPLAGLINVGGTLYGTTSDGGAYSYYGTVFSLDRKTGAETVLHSFQENASDGGQPQAGLIKVNGVLYGTAIWGGAYSSGAIFSVDPETGTETLVYSFCSQQNCTDGREPIASLIDVKGTLYGTTYAGGASGLGTVFSITPDGTEKVLHSFGSGADGAYPLAGLVHVRHMLYATTFEGGAYSGGTLFSLDLKSGDETVLHSFQYESTDGYSPRAGLIAVNGSLYGTTTLGGTGTCSSGCGTVFSLDPANNAETVVYSFQNNGADGAYPEAGLIDVGGTLYGTTSSGGPHTYYGTVFSIDPQAGVETVMHAFRPDGSDGEQPEAGLINVKGTLYGTTVFGGVNGDGTVFSIRP